jgi:hypothetical protein
VVKIRRRRRRRRLAAITTTSRWLEHPPLLLRRQQLMGAMVRVVTSGCGSSPVVTRAIHGARCHNMECREIKKLTEQFHKQVKQQPRQEGALSRQQKGK